jgi:hypothetical protein
MADAILASPAWPAVVAAIREGYVPAALSPEWKAELELSRQEGAEAALARVEERVGALEWESLGHGRYIWRARVLAIIAEERGDG